MCCHAARLQVKSIFLPPEHFSQPTTILTSRVGPSIHQRDRIPELAMGTLEKVQRLSFHNRDMGRIYLFWLDGEIQGNEIMPIAGPRVQNKLKGKLNQFISWN